MALLTTFCRECARVALIDERRAEAGRLPCPRCGAHVSIVPGCSFSSDDQGLFEDLLQIASEGALTPDRFRPLAAEIAQSLRAGADTRSLLERLTVPFPGLLPIQTAAGRNDAARLRALRVLRAVLDAKSLERESLKRD